MENFDKVFDFIKENEGSDTGRMRLRCASSPDRHLMEFAIDQIECRKKFSSKLSRFIASPEFLFPSVLAGEQASNQEVALYNASVVGEVESVLDMTSGLGIDIMTFAINGANACTAIDIDQVKSDILRHNCSCSGIENITVINADSLEYLRNSDRYFDVIFVDPVRRSDTGSRVFAFQQCQPDIIADWTLLASHTSRIIIKASPMIDITQVLEEIPDVRSLYIVCIRGECKELLIESVPGKDGCSHGVEVRVVDISGAAGNDLNLICDFCFRMDERHEKAEVLETNDITGKYLCIPNAGIMKTGAWGIFAKRYGGMKKASPNTHLFVTDKKPENFPGRVLRVESLMNNKTLKKLKGVHRNVVCRNYPLSATQLSAKAGIIDGGDSYLIGCRLTRSETPVLISAIPVIYLQSTQS